MVSEKLKQVIFKKLYMDLEGVEIIPYKDSIYFIDREKKYWYFEYEKKGKLWWRYDFFSKFFLLFCLKTDDYERVMGKWVEEVLNCKVSSTITPTFMRKYRVEEVLNCKVSSTVKARFHAYTMVEEVLNCKVSSTRTGYFERHLQTEEVLNYRVSSISVFESTGPKTVEEVLKTNLVL